MQDSGPRGPGLDTPELKPPAELNLTGNVEDQWKRFKQRFSLYLVAIGAAEKDDQQKVALFLTVACSYAIDVFNSFQLTGEEQKNYELVLTRFQTFCTPKRNETFERYLFNSRCQIKSETVEEFIMDLRLKSQSCNFGQLSDSLIRDTIVIGVRDKALREKLLSENDLTLERAVQMCQAREVTQSRKRSMDIGVVGDTECKVEYISKKDVTAKRCGSKESAENRQQRTCGNCGGVHLPRQCPAYGKECHHCGMNNHFALKCRQ